MRCQRVLNVTWVALLGILLVGEFAAIMAENIGDCYGLNQLPNAFCDAPQVCNNIQAGTYNCFDQTHVCTNGTCDPSPCAAVLATDLRMFGYCTSMEGASGCTQCDRYICGWGTEYQSIDENMQFQRMRCNGWWKCTGCCVPSP